MKGIHYSSGEAVQASFKRKSHQNLSISSSAATSQPIAETEVVVSMTVGAHIAFNETATTASMVLPAGVWFIGIDKGSTISLLKLTGSEDGQGSIIVME